MRGRAVLIIVPHARQGEKGVIRDLAEVTNIVRLDE